MTESESAAESASEERFIELLTAYERHRSEKNRREFVRGFLNAARVAAAKEVDKNTTERRK